MSPSSTYLSFSSLVISYSLSIHVFPSSIRYSVVLSHQFLFFCSLLFASTPPLSLFISGPQNSSGAQLTMLVTCTLHLAKIYFHGFPTASTNTAVTFSIRTTEILKSASLEKAKCRSCIEARYHCEQGRGRGPRTCRTILHMLECSELRELYLILWHRHSPHRLFR